MLGRNPDALGLALYVGELDAGRTSLETIALNVLDGVRNEDIAMIENRLMACGHYVGRQRELADAANPVQDTILAQVIAGVGTGSLGSGEQQAHAACGVFDDLIGIDPTVAAGAFTEDYLSGITLYAVFFGQGYDHSGTPLPGDSSVVQELQFEPDGTVVATGLRDINDGTSTWAVDSTGLLYFGDTATDGNRIACDHGNVYTRHTQVFGRDARPSLSRKPMCDGYTSGPIASKAVDSTTSTCCSSTVAPHWTLPHP